MRRWNGLVSICVLLALSGCASREFYRQEAEVPWEQEGVRRVKVGAFQAQPNAWTVAEAARRRVVSALERGTVSVVERQAQATLEGAVTVFEVSSTPGAPRRVIVSGSDAGLRGAYRWQMDVTHTVRLAIALRVLNPDGRVLWSRESQGLQTESEVVTMNWPGGDPVPPPAILPNPTPLYVYDRLRERALDEALGPLVAALTLHYGYKGLD